MGGPFTFLGGLAALIASGFMGYSDRHRYDRENAEYRNGNHNMSLQVNKYEDSRYMRDYYDIKDVMDAVRDEYPNMSDANIYTVARLAIGKKLMESETSFHYYVPPTFRCLGDIERFAKDEYREQ